MNNWSCLRLSITLIIAFATQAFATMLLFNGLALLLWDSSMTLNYQQSLVVVIVVVFLMLTTRAIAQYIIKDTGVRFGY